MKQQAIRISTTEPTAHLLVLLREAVGAVAFIGIALWLCVGLPGIIL